MTNLDQVSTALTATQQVLVIAHVSPDGDTLGAALALGGALAQLGKAVTFTCQDPVPGNYAFLPGSRLILTPDLVMGQVFDAAVAVDVADSRRLGNAQTAFQAAGVKVVIDHHGTNDRFGQINWIEPSAAATGVLVYRLIRQMGVKVTPDMAAQLYTAICTDTGNFNFASTDGEALRAAADLVEAGAQVSDLTRKLYRTRSKPGVLLLARALASLTFQAQERLAYMVLAQQDFEQTGASEDMSEGVVNYAIEIVGVQVAFLARETPQGTKFSLRSMPHHDVSAVAQQFGGGGHPAAAGCTLQVAPQEAVAQMVGAIMPLLAG